MKMNGQRRGSRVGGRCTARLTSKYQATIPKNIREKLHLESGEYIVYESLSDDSVLIRKSTPLDVEYLKALNTTMNEWMSNEDEQAYKNLSTCRKTNSFRCGM